MVTQTLSDTNQVSLRGSILLSESSGTERIHLQFLSLSFEIRGVCVILLAHIWVLHLRQTPSTALASSSCLKQHTILDGDSHILVELVCRVHHVDKVMVCDSTHFIMFGLLTYVRCVDTVALSQIHENAVLAQ